MIGAGAGMMKHPINRRALDLAPERNDYKELENALRRGSACLASTRNEASSGTALNLLSGALAPLAGPNAETLT
jgi:hypothetical protein